MDKVFAKNVYKFDELSGVVMNFGNNGITINGKPIDEYAKEKGKDNKNVQKS
ncbi:MAG: hypothetical protein IJP96_07915 [Synergistaceae bacterium]|nr:hypothetical protein [Synergistaceae bacterium]